jgi:Type II secretion system (T2SS), protein E, N-terminal domain
LPGNAVSQCREGTHLAFTWIENLPMSQTNQPTAEEREQIMQTIEMFGVIVQTSPNDAQSLEILKDAFVRIGQIPEAMEAARKLGQLYTDAEQYSQAVKEYEYVLDHDPANVDVMTALGEVEEKLRAAKANGAVVDDTITIKNSQLIATVGTTKVATRSAASIDAVTKMLVEDGNDALVKFLLLHRIAPQDVVKSSHERVSKKNKDLAPNTMAHSLLDEVVRRAGLDLETTLCTIVDRSKVAYIPLEYYEVDRQVVKMLPDSLTLGRLIVPFDVMSRTLMVAMANPFDVLGKEAVQKLLDFNIQWHIASPAAITKVLSEVYRVAPPGMIGATPDTPGMKLAAASA